MKFPIGIQQFQELRTDGWVYVDKTAHVFKLVNEGKYYFLSRPRRFGKSMLLSTIEAYFQGRKDLFKGLAIESLENDWIEYPVLHLDLNAEKYATLEELENILDTQLREWELKYDSTEGSNPSLSRRFSAVIHAAYTKTGQKVVVLVDEYDKPLLQNIANTELQDEMRSALKAFYGTLKSTDGDLRFAMLTGVTKFSKVSVFSDLNNLKDISMSPQFYDICGISDDELHNVFDEEVEKLAEANSQTKEFAYEMLCRRYDGYHFCSDTPGVYNPFSILWTLSDRRYGSYWFSTGTPTYLVELMKEVELNPFELSGYEASWAELDNINVKVDNPIAVLYQSGYLTIKGYDRRFNTYTLDYPNEEVKEGFVNFLLPYYIYSKSIRHSTVVSHFVQALETGDAECFMQLLQSLMADIPYELIPNLEVHYQNVIYIIVKLMGLYVQAEYRTSRGRIDLLVGTDKYVYIIELKLDGSAEDAVKQINDKDYSLPFAATGKIVIKIGANVSRETRNIDEWIVE